MTMTCPEQPTCSTADTFGSLPTTPTQKLYCYELGTGQPAAASWQVSVWSESAQEASDIMQVLADTAGGLTWQGTSAPAASLEGWQS